MSDADREAKVRRAKEVLAGADWVFDEFVNTEMANILSSPASARDGREIAYQRARAATEMKANMLRMIEESAIDIAAAERKAAMEERKSANEKRIAEALQDYREIFGRTQ